MRHEDVREALEYLYWTRDRILAAAAGLADEAFRSEESVTTRSLRGTLVHQLECEWAWRVRFTGGAFPDETFFAPDDFPTVPPLVEWWSREERVLRDWLESLSDADLATRPAGSDNALALWRYLVYVVNHGTQQFSEAAVLLTRLGRSPGEIGYLAFCSERPAPRR
jgi:uncharacterized damage-inducible protein DinB